LIFIRSFISGFIRSFISFNRICY